MPDICPEIQQNIDALKSSKQDFDASLAHLLTISDQGPKDQEAKQTVKTAWDLKEEIERQRSILESQLHVSLKQAQEIMDTEGERNFMGPEQVKIAFGIEMKDIPKIPFSKEELERARELGQMLVLRMDQAPDGQPLTMAKMKELLQSNFTKQYKGKVLYSTNWYQNEDFFIKEKPQAGWALVSKEVIPDSVSSNYLVQTEKLITYLKEHVFKVQKDQELPEVYQKAIEEFQRKRQQEKLDELITQDWQKAAQILENLQITQLLRQSTAEILYDLLIYFQNTGQRLMENRYTWSRRRHSDGRLVSVGYFDTDGAHVDGGRPDYSDDDLGVVFSRGPL